MSLIIVILGAILALTTELGQMLLGMLLVLLFTFSVLLSIDELICEEGEWSTFDTEVCDS